MLLKILFLSQSLTLHPLLSEMHHLVQAVVEPPLGLQVLGFAVVSHCVQFIAKCAMYVCVG